MIKFKNNHIVDLFFTLTLFGVFAISAIFVVFFGARVYENTVNSMTRNFTSRTAVSYIMEKIRHRDTQGSITLTNFDESPAVVLIRRKDLDFETTYIYAKDGYLMEITVDGSDYPDTANGQRLLELNTFQVREVSTGMYYLSITDKDGNTDNAYISTKCDHDIFGSSVLAPNDLQDDSMLGPVGPTAPTE